MAARKESLMLYPMESSTREKIAEAVTWVVFAATGILALAVIF